ncbi:MAG: ROK family protein [Chryseolinea sp.]
MGAKIAIGIDLGCTNIKGVLVDEHGKILSELKEDTHEQNDAYWKDAVMKMIHQLGQQVAHRDYVIGLSAPGLADAANNCITFMPGRLPGLENFDWTRWIGERVFVLNDAHAALMAEAAFGAAKGLQHAVLLSLGTGIGGGILIDGKLYQGVGQMAGHIGHTSVNASSEKRDVTNMVGSIEEAFGSVSINERSHGRYDTTEALVGDYVKGDKIATWIWLNAVQKLAVSIASTINILSPEVLILSGGITNAKEALLEPLKSFLGLYEWRPGGKKTEIRFANFSERAGAIGAGAFALSKMNPTI